VQVSITVEQTIAQTLVQQGKSVPTPIAGWALIDTGASVTCIDEEAAVGLGLPVVDQVVMSSASHAKTLQNVYPVQIVISGLAFIMNVPKAMGAALKPQGILALIGRDALQVCTLFYNGLTGEVTISI
jgi:predicted aspartyl protease